MYQSIPKFLCLLLLGITVGCTSPLPPTGSDRTPTPSVSQPILESGYKTIIGEGVALSLPKRYEGGNPSKDLKAIAQKLQALDANYEKRLEAIKQNPAAVALLAFDPDSAKSGNLTNVNIVSEKIPQGVNLEQYMKAATQSLESQFKIVDQEIVSLRQNQAGKIIAEAKNTPLKHLYYIVPGGDKFWIVTYSTSVQDFNKQLPDFEKSIRSFALQPKKSN